MPKMPQFMISTDEQTRDRLDALRIVMASSRAEVGRQAILCEGLEAMERVNAARLGRLRKLARTTGYPHWNAFVWALIERYGQKMPTLERLEDLQAELSAARDKSSPLFSG